MNLQDIIFEILKQDLLEETYNELHKIIMNRYVKMEGKNAEYKAIIGIIRKINRNKNKAIDALCDTSNEQVRIK